MDGSMSSRNRGRVSVRPGYRNEVNPSGHEKRTLWGMGKYQEGAVSPWQSHSSAFRPRQLDHRLSFVGVEGFENI